MNASQVLKGASEQELPWVAAAVLHLIATSSLVDSSAQAIDPAAQAAETLLESCCACTNGAALSAVHEVLHSAVRQQPQTAGELSSCSHEIPFLASCLHPAVEWRQM